MDAMFSTMWPVLLIMFVAVVWIRRSNHQRHKEQVEINTTNAKLHGMGYQPPTPDDASGTLQGVHRFDGTTRGIVWNVETLYLNDQDAGVNTHTYTNSQNYTRWTASQAGTAAGALILMNLPQGVKAPQIDSGQGNSGFWSAVADKAANAAFQLFARLTFGNARSNTLPLSAEHRVQLAQDAFGSAFVAFSDQPDLLVRLNENARELLLQERDQRVAFLWDSQGLTLTWPVPFLSPEDIAKRSDFGALLAEALRE